MSTQQTVELNQAKAQAFGERMLGVLNSAALTLMGSIGHRTGLFDLLADMPPSNSEQIASRAGLNERYVREWLGAMVTGGVVEYDPQLGTYVLPPEHAASLTRPAGPNNIASTMQWIAVLGQVEDQIIECFTTGGGVHYSSFSRFHSVMAEESAQTVVGALHEHILPLVPGLVEALEHGIDVLDVGCGAGRAMNALAASFPNSRFSGYDFSEEAIGTANADAQARGLDNAHFAVRNAAAIGEAAKYDLITAFDAIHDQADPDRVLREINAALRPDGTFLMQDIASSSHLQNNLGHLIGPFLYTISTMHCMTVSLAQGGKGLGTCWGEELAADMLKQAGFNLVRVERLPHDILNCYYIVKKQ